MSSPNFRFKHFTVWHDKCAMKVGTDGVLLGAWCPLPDSPISYRVLDIGTGSGLIALMLAQRLNGLPSTGAADLQEPLAQSLIGAPEKARGFLGRAEASNAPMSRSDSQCERLPNAHCQLSTVNCQHIDAIDIDADAVVQASENFAQSPWADILYVHHSTLQDWPPCQPSTGAADLQRSDLPSIAYDLIVSNPPYFQDSLKNPNAQRAAARHTDTLSYEELIVCAARLLKPNGVLALVLPFEAKEDILTLAQANGLYPTHITHVHSKPGKPAKRLLIALQRSDLSTVNCQLSTVTFYIESSTSPRSEEYKELTKDFYL